MRHNLECFKSFCLPCSYEPVESSHVCLSYISACGQPDCLALNVDHLLLAVASKRILHVYAVFDLTQQTTGLGDAIKPIYDIHLPADVRTFLWCRAPGFECTYMFLTDTSILMKGDLRSLGHTKIDDDVRAACWSPNATTLVYVIQKTMLVFQEQDGTKLCTLNTEGELQFW